METTRVNNVGPQSCWLDLLPSEIRKAIACQVCDFQYSDVGLHLAQTSEEMGDAVVAALSNNLNLGALSVHLNTKCIEWAEIFKGKVRNIQLKKAAPPFAYFSLTPHLQHLFTSPALRTAEIPDEIPFIRAISGLSSLRELKVIGLNGVPDNAIHLQESLKTLDLFKLEFQCRAPLHSRCAIHASRFWNDLLENVPEHCPNLHTFGIQSYPPNLEDSSRPYTLWNMLPRLKDLRHITIDQRPPTWALETLRKVESVYVHDISSGLFAASDIRLSVTGLKISSRLHGEQVEVLSQFCRLKELDINVFSETENELLASVQNMPELRSLSVHWGPVRRSLSRERINQSVQSGVLLRIVRSCPKLEKLEFKFVPINSGEVYDMLMSLGTRLRHFGMSVHGQLKTPYEKLDIILRALYTYNPNIESFSIGSAGLRDPRLDFVSPSWYATSISENEKRDLVIMLNRLQCRNPAIDLSEPWDLVSRAKTQTAGSSSERISRNRQGPTSWSTM